MFEIFKRCPLYVVVGAVLVAGAAAVEMSGIAFGGSRKAQRVDPSQIRQSSPGSWTYIYWAHGSRGK